MTRRPETSGVCRRVQACARTKPMGRCAGERPAAAWFWCCCCNARCGMDKRQTKGKTRKHTNHVLLLYAPDRCAAVDTTNVVVNAWPPTESRQRQRFRRTRAKKKQSSAAACCSGERMANRVKTMPEATKNEFCSSKYRMYYCCCTGVHKYTQPSSREKKRAHPPPSCWHRMTQFERSSAPISFLRSRPISAMPMSPQYTPDIRRCCSVVVVFLF